MFPSQKSPARIAENQANNLEIKTATNYLRTTVVKQVARALIDGSASAENSQLQNTFHRFGLVNFITRNGIR